MWILKPPDSPPPWPHRYINDNLRWQKQVHHQNYIIIHTVSLINALDTAPKHTIQSFGRSYLTDRFFTRHICGIFIEMLLLIWTWYAHCQSRPQRVLMFSMRQTSADDRSKNSQNIQKWQHFGISWLYLESPWEMH